MQESTCVCVSSSRTERFYAQNSNGYLGMDHAGHKLAMKRNEHLMLMLVSNASRPKLTLEQRIYHLEPFSA